MAMPGAQFVRGNEPETNLVAGDSRSPSSEQACDPSPFDIDLVVRASGTEQVGDPERETVNDQKVPTVRNGECPMQVERRLERHPASRPIGAMPRDPGSHLVVTRLRGGDEGDRQPGRRA